MLRAYLRQNDRLVATDVDPALDAPLPRGSAAVWYNLTDPIALPKGSKIECTAHFDNSPNNLENADPTKEVTWGEQSWDEMMVGFFNLVFDAKMPVENLFADKKNNAGIAKN